MNGWEKQNEITFFLVALFVHILLLIVVVEHIKLITFLLLITFIIIIQTKLRIFYSTRVKY